MSRFPYYNQNLIWINYQLVCHVQYFYCFRCSLLSHQSWCLNLTGAQCFLLRIHDHRQHFLHLHCQLHLWYFYIFRFLILFKCRSECRLFLFFLSYPFTTSSIYFIGVFPTEVFLNICCTFFKIRCNNNTSV